MAFFADILGTLRDSFKIKLLTLSSSALTAARTISFPDLAGNVVVDALKNVANGYVGLDADKQVLIDCNSTGAALEIRQIGSGNALVIEDSTNPDSTPIVIDNSGKIIAGTSTALTASGSLSPFYQSVSNSQSAGFGVFSYINSTASGNHIFAKSKSNTIGTHVIGVAGDVIGNCRYDHSDGINFINSAIIRASIDATPSTGIIPGRVSIYTSDLAGVVNEGLRVNSNGSLRVGLSTATGTGISTTIAAKLYVASATYTDSTTAASGTVAHGTVVSIDNPAIAASNTSVTYTNLSTVYIDGAPTAGTNVTITNPWAFYIAAGNSYFGGNINVNGATASTIAGFDASKNLVTLATATYPSLTELAYVKGLTSAVQTQLDTKRPPLIYAAQHFIRTPVSVVSSSTVVTITTTYYTPIYINRDVTIDALSIKSGSGHTGTTVMRLGLYNHDAATGKPSTLKKDAGTVSLTASNQAVVATFTGIALTKGLYWVASNAVSAGGTLQVAGATAGSSIYNELLGAITDSTGSTFYLGFTESYNATTAFTTAGTLTATAVVPFVFARIS